MMGILSIFRPKSKKMDTKNNDGELLQVQENSLSKDRCEEGWQLIDYYNEEWNFSIKYPANWEVAIENESSGSWMIPIALAGPKIGSIKPCFMINARRGEVLEGNSNMIVNHFTNEGRIVKVPRTPQEYIEQSKKDLPNCFPGFSYIDGQELRIANKPAAKLEYCYDGEYERIQEESITLFGVNMTFQFVCEMPFNPSHEVKKIFKSIIDSFRVGNAFTEEMHDYDKLDVSEPSQTESDIDLYNKGVHLYKKGLFEKAMDAFNQCFSFEKYQMQAAYARSICQKELGLPVEYPERFKDRTEEIYTLFVASNLICYLEGEGHHTILTKQDNSTCAIETEINGAVYIIYIKSFLGSLMNMAWRKEGPKTIPLTDRSANPNPTETDKLVISIVERASSLPISPLPNEGLNIKKMVKHAFMEKMLS
ncbi:MAG: PsbP-related protein [Candidatus Hodarchaeota archaeon]